MREIQDRIDDAELGDIPVQLITISFDPENDTPDALAKYAKA